MGKENEKYTGAVYLKGNFQLLLSFLPVLTSSLSVLFYNELG